MSWSGEVGDVRMMEAAGGERVVAEVGAAAGEVAEGRAGLLGELLPVPGGTRRPGAADPVDQGESPGAAGIVSNSARSGVMPTPPAISSTLRWRGRGR